MHQGSVLNLSFIETLITKFLTKVVKVKFPPHSLSRYNPLWEVNG